MAGPSTKPFSLSFGSSKSKPPAPIPPRKRPHSALAEQDSDHEDDSGPQTVTAFDQSAGGAIGSSAIQTKAPLVIQVEKNRDWREESRRKRGKNILPAEVQAQKDGVVNGVSTHERDEVSKTSGLQFAQRDEGGDVPMSNAQKAEPTPQEPTNGAPTVDEEALQALLGGEKKSTLVLPVLGSDYQNGTTNGDNADDYTNEDDRFKADVASRPESASLDDYARIPVEDFGPALLRGMGWKEGEVIGKQNSKATAPRVVERRPALLGIGAKEAPRGLGDELGAWGKTANGRRKPDPMYNPIVLKNSVTGEMFTEEELEKKKQDQKKTREDSDWRERRDRNLAIDAGRKSEQREKDRPAVGDGKEGRRRQRSRSSEWRRHSGSRRERSRSVERSGYGSSKRERSRSMERRRRRDYDEYDGKYRERDTDREREKGKHKDRDRDWDRYREHRRK